MTLQPQILLQELALESVHSIIIHDKYHYDNHISKPGTCLIVTLSGRSAFKHKTFQLFLHSVKNEGSKLIQVFHSPKEIKFYSFKALTDMVI